MNRIETPPLASDHDGGSTAIDLPISSLVGSNFNFENAVCSHGLFMMAPNKWDPHSKTLERPLRLGDYNSPSVNVQISHPQHTPKSLLLRVFDVHSLSDHQKHSLMGQVRRMLRLSKEEEQNVREFQEMYVEAKKKGFGRLFRSPTLFEDMVKCILLCNCQWSRTLSMARALCEIQMELKCHLSRLPVHEASDCSASRNPVAEINHFLPRTPAGKEVRRRNGSQKGSLVSTISNTEFEKEMEKDVSFNTDYAEISGSDSNDTQGRNFPTEKYNKFYMSSDASTLGESPRVDLNLTSDAKSSEITYHYSSNCTGNFPSPAELVSIDENILANRCKLGYRAKRIISLAQNIVEGRIQLGQLEEACSRPSLSIYRKLADQLKEIEGFGPYTCANVLMCMGFYHAVPSDSETIRHVKQVHKKTSNIRSIGQDVEVIYGKYAPFQYLVYWSEVWSFYEERFGRLSEMIQSDYKLITATNLTPRTPRKQKKIKRIKLP